MGRFISGSGAPVPLSDLKPERFEPAPRDDEEHARIVPAWEPPRRQATVGFAHLKGKRP